MKENMLMVGMQIMAVRMIQDDARIGTSAMSKYMDATEDETKELIEWTRRLWGWNLYLDFMVQRPNLYTDLWDLEHMSLIRYGNDYVRTLFPRLCTNYDKMAEKVKKIAGIESEKYTGEYLKQFLEEYATFRKTQINACGEKYDTLVVKEMVNDKVDFENPFEVGFLEGYLESRKKSVDIMLKEMTVEEIIKALDMGEDEQMMFFPTDAFQKETTAFMEKTIKIMQKRNMSYGQIEQMNPILAGIAILNHTTPEVVIKCLNKAVD